jgi:uncharacterized protein YkwD
MQITIPIKYLYYVLFLVIVGSLILFYFNYYGNNQIETNSNQSLTSYQSSTMNSQSLGTQTVESNITGYEIPYVLDFTTITIYFPTSVQGLLNESNLGDPLNSWLIQGWQIQYADLPEMQTTNQKVELQLINGMYQQSISKPLTIHPATVDYVAQGQEIFLNLLNNERTKYNLSTLTLEYNNTIAQNRANDMIARNYFSHVTPPPFFQNWSYGSPPNLVYTQSGGQNYIEENLMERHCLSDQACILIVNQSDLQNYVNEDLHSFIYEDNSSNWDHRNSLLNPCFNFVSVGMNWTDSQYRLVAHMEGKWIRWTNPPTIDNGLFTASGYIDKRFTLDERLDNVMIFFASPFQISQMVRSYSLGDLYARTLLYSPYAWVGINTIYPGTFTYSQSTGFFNLGFRLNLENTGVYTVVMIANDTYGIPHPFISDWSYTCELFEYSVPFVSQ